MISVESSLMLTLLLLPIIVIAALTLFRGLSDRGARTFVAIAFGLGTIAVIVLATLAGETDTGTAVSCGAWFRVRGADGLSFDVGLRALAHVHWSSLIAMLIPALLAIGLPVEEERPFRSFGVGTAAVSAGVLLIAWSTTWWLLLVGWNLVVLPIAVLILLERSQWTGEDEPGRFLLVGFVATVLLTAGVTLTAAETGSLQILDSTATARESAIPAPSSNMQLAGHLILWSGLLGAAQFPVFHWLTGVVHYSARVCTLCLTAMLTASLTVLLRAWPLLALTDSVPDAAAFLGAVTVLLAGFVLTSQPDWRWCMAFLSAWLGGFVTCGLSSATYAGLLGAVVLSGFACGVVLAMGLLVPTIVRHSGGTEFGSGERQVITAKTTRQIGFAMIVTIVSGLWGQSIVMSALIQRAETSAFHACCAIAMTIGTISGSFGLWRMWALGFHRKPIEPRVHVAGQGEERALDWLPAVLAIGTMVAIAPLLLIDDQMIGLFSLGRSTHGLGQTQFAWAAWLPLIAGFLGGAYFWVRRNSEMDVTSGASSRSSAVVRLIARQRLFLSSVYDLILLFVRTAIAQMTRLIAGPLLTRVVVGAPRFFLRYLSWVGRPMRSSSSEFHGLAMLFFMAVILLIFVWLGA